MPLVVGDLQKGFLCFNPGVADEDIEAAKLSYRLPGHALDLAAFVDVRGDGQGALPTLLDRSLHLHSVVLAARMIIDDYVGAFRGETFGDCLTNSARRPGDQCHLVF